MRQAFVNFVHEKILLLVSFLALITKELIVKYQGAALLVLYHEVLESLFHLLEVLATNRGVDGLVVVVNCSLEADICRVEGFEHVFVVVDDRHLVDQYSSLVVDEASDLGGGDSSPEVFGVAPEVLGQVV